MSCRICRGSAHGANQRELQRQARSLASYRSHKHNPSARNRASTSRHFWSAPKRHRVVHYSGPRRRKRSVFRTLQHRHSLCPAKSKHPRLHLSPLQIPTQNPRSAHQCRGLRLIPRRLLPSRPSLRMSRRTSASFRSACLLIARDSSLKSNHAESGVVRLARKRVYPNGCATRTRLRRASHRRNPSPQQDTCQLAMRRRN